MEQRTLKFRAWDPTSKEFVFTGFHVIGEVTLFGVLQQHSLELQRIADLHVTQFTGLKDKNGREIYEGDIIAVPYVTPFGDVTEQEDNDLRGHVVFRCGSFGIAQRHNTTPLREYANKEYGAYVPNYGTPTIYLDTTVVEMIGNIYEHPALLNA